MSRIPTSLSMLVAICASSLLFAQQEEGPRANFEQADHYSSSYLSQRTYSTSVDPQWIGETNRFWYSYRTARGTRYTLVDPDAGTRAPLFGHERLAEQLSVEVKKPLDAEHLVLSRAEIDDAGAKLSFVVEETKFELALATGKLENLGAAPKEERERPNRGRRARGESEGEEEESPEKDPRQHRNFAPDRTAYVFIEDHNLYYVEASDEVKSQVREIDARMKAEKDAKDAEKTGVVVEKKDDGKLDVEKLDVEKKGDEKQDVEKQGDEKQDVGKQDVEKKDVEKKDVEKKDVGKQDVGKQDDEKQDVGKKDVGKQDVEKQGGEKKADEKKGADDEKDEVDERERWADDVDETQALKLTDDGKEDYEFSSGRGNRRGAELVLDEDAYLEGLQAGEVTYFPDDEEEQDDGEGTEEEEEEDSRVRPRVNWAPDSTAFYITRRDSRGVEELFLVNSLSEPRPTLEKYDYPLPGEEHVGTSELHVFDRARKTLFQVDAKWKDETYQDLHWPKAPDPPDDAEDGEEAEPDEAELAGAGDELRMIRRDRLMRNVELCSIDTRTGETKVLIEEGFEGANIAPQSVRYLKDRGEMIWWSERTGWGHFYLYDQGGELKNAITSGPFRASRIVEVDQDKGLLYFRGNGREPGENVYLQHLYRVFLDGTGLTLMDPGNAYHNSELAPTHEFAVDNCSRIDMAPVSRLCDADGKEVMKLEEADLSRLYEAGWTMPETFTFKAADGVTDLYGNMWKPFDFDPDKKYPIIAEVYPGPQTEGVSNSFSASNGRQQLAQIGFIVVQLGHRGGTPGRSKAYHSYGYFNLRDYGLADKKAGIEQLAERHPFIDIERVGIYGHSGGGFMTAAAMLREPYNDFFKVGVASSGNHDNNVYGRYWAERYHGLKRVEVVKDKKGRARDGEERNSEETKDGSGDEMTVEKKKGDGDQKSIEKQKEGDGSGKGVEKKKGDDGKESGVEKKKADDGSEKDGGKQEKDKKDEDLQEDDVEIKFEIHVPTNAELAANLKGHLLLVHGDMDNNVHPAGTMRLVDALIKANKRFDMLILPGKRHGYGDDTAYFTERKWEFFAEHLLGDRPSGVDIR